MKKQAYTYVLYPLVIISLMLLLPFLRSKPDNNLDSMLFVKAAFFDKVNGEYEIRIYSTDAESGEEHFFSGGGKEIGEAIENAKNGSYKNLYFPSAEVLLLGDGIHKEEFYELSEYAVRSSDFPLSAAVFKGEEELASADFIKIVDAVKARSISDDMRLWRRINELISEDKEPSVFEIRKGTDGKIYFEG